MHDEGLQLLLDDHGETITVTPPGGSGAYQPRALVEEISPQPWRHDARGNEVRRHARAEIRLAECPTVPAVTKPAWQVTARGIVWQVVGLSSGPVSVHLVLQHITGTNARGPRPGGL